MSQQNLPAVDFSNQAIEAVFKRAIRNTVILAIIATVVLLVGAGWRDAAMLATGTLISAASIFEWQRLVRVINAKLDKQETPRSAPAVVIFFVLRLTIFAGVIYGSLKCFQGSVIALLCGLGLAALAIGWEAISMLRD
jgi:uncharacterized membrane protein